MFSQMHYKWVIQIFFSHSYFWLNMLIYQQKQPLKLARSNIYKYKRETGYFAYKRVTLLLTTCLKSTQQWEDTKNVHHGWGTAYLLTFWKSLEGDIPLCNSKKREILHNILFLQQYFFFFEDSEVFVGPENDLFLPDIVYKLTKFRDFNFKLLVFVNKLDYHIEIWYNYGI